MALDKATLNRLRRRIATLAFAETRERCEATGEVYHRALCDLDEAEMYLELNLIDEALRATDAAFRSFELLGPRCRVLILHDVIEDGEEGSCVAAPLGAGVLPRDRVRALIARHVPDETDVVLHPGPVGPQLEWLGRL